MKLVNRLSQAAVACRQRSWVTEAFTGSGGDWRQQDGQVWMRSNVPWAGLMRSG